MSLVRRSTNRQERPATTCEPSSSKEETPKERYVSQNGKVYITRTQQDTAWIPESSAILKLMFSLRLSAALWSTISDCDEVFNYWEPLHLLLFGEGFQTWEYSPLYAIRSYFYIYLHYLPANILATLFPYSKIAIFVCMRCLLGIFCLFAEFELFKAISARLGNSIGRFYLVFTVLSTGMFVSCTAFLPSTFAMVCNMLAMSSFLKEQWFAAIFCTALSALVGWPFAALLGIPIAVNMLLIRPKQLASQFVYFSLLSAFVIGGSLVTVDSYYYGKRVLAPLNIVMYNVFSGHGPDLYGVEPLSFYLKNLVLNWNIVAVLAPLGLPLSVIVYNQTFKSSPNDRTVLGIIVSPAYWRRFEPVLLLSLSLFAWCLVFFTQPHKEERFLFPIYPLIAIFGAIALDAMQRLISRYSYSLSKCAWLVVLGFVVLSLSRTYALHRNFGAHIEVYKSLNEHFAEMDHKIDFSDRGDPLRVCVGKEWYRFPSSFFLPNAVVDKHNQSRGVKLHFLKSEFAGLLPKYYEKGSIPNITRLIPTEMNDLNKEELGRYVPFDSCDYIIDVDAPSEFVTALEPDYSLRSDHLRQLYSHPFLVASQSNWIFRAFYVPFFTHRYTVFTTYSLYQRIVPTVL